MSQVTGGGRPSSLELVGARKKEDPLDRQKRLAELEREGNYTSTDLAAGLKDFILIVDGYNVCGSNLKSILGLEGDFLAGGPAEAEHALVTELQRYQPYSKYSLIVCVFDNSGAGSIDHKRERSTDDVEVVHAPDADEWIRNEAKAIAADEGSEYLSVDVASNDGEVIASVQGNPIAFPISSEYLLKDMESMIPKMESEPNDYHHNLPFKTSKPDREYRGNDALSFEKLGSAEVSQNIDTISGGWENLLSEQKFHSPFLGKVRILPSGTPRHFKAGSRGRNKKKRKKDGRRRMAPSKDTPELAQTYDAR